MQALLVSVAPREILRRDRVLSEEHTNDVVYSCNFSKSFAHDRLHKRRGFFTLWRRKSDRKSIGCVFRIAIRNKNNVSHARGNPGRAYEKGKERELFLREIAKVSTARGRTSLTAEAAGRRTATTMVEAEEAMKGSRRAETFEIIATAENFADFKRVSSGLSNGTRMRITRPTGSAGRRGVYKSRRLTVGYAVRKFRAPTNSRGRRKRRWRKEKTERKMRNDEGRARERKRETESGKEWQLNAISRESNGSRLETRGSD